MTDIRKRHLLLYVGLLLLQIVLYYNLRHLSDYVEIYYSNGVYPYIARAMRIGLGWIPFSFGDIIYIVGIVMILRWLWYNSVGLITFSLLLRFRESVMRKEACATPDAVRKRNKKNHTAFNIEQKSRRAVQLFTALNIILLLFHVLWGFNYYRMPLNESLGIKKEYTVEQLIKTTEKFALLSNVAHSNLQAVDSLPVAFKRSQQELFAIAASGFQQIPQPQLRQELAPLSVKESLLTMPLTYMGYSGYLNPITGEAHTNAWINCYKTPVLILHEMSHQLGFAKENEANYIAITAGIHHEDSYFNYSAYIFGLRYLLNDLYSKDPIAFERIKGNLRTGILKNYKELSDFWAPYNDGLIEQASQAAYNQYLKANNQPDGLKTYSYVVSLLVNE